MDKVYCIKCVYLSRSGGTRNVPGDKCLSPIDNWLSPTAPCNLGCDWKNHNNDCKDFREKEDEVQRL